MCCFNKELHFHYIFEFRRALNRGERATNIVRPVRTEIYLMVKEKEEEHTQRQTLFESLVQVRARALPTTSSPKNLCISNNKKENEKKALLVFVNKSRQF